MPTPDLPAELWLEILEYLPRSTLQKMIGVNRTLFELALNDIYEEVRFIGDDKDMLKTFKQLKHGNIARRVSHLFIRPAFLPGMDEDVSSSFDQKLASGFTYIKNLTRRTPPILSSELLCDPAYEILDVASKAVKSCPNLRELTVVLHDHALTPNFMTFLDSLWASDSIGPNLRKLAIDTTLVKLPLLLKPLVNCSELLTNLEEFELTLSVTRFQQTATDWHFAKEGLASFFTAFRRSLTAVTLSSAVICDLSGLFEDLPRLSNLKKFELFAVFNLLTFPRTQDLTQFVSKHAPTLEKFTIKPRPRHVSFNSSDDTYTLWLNHDLTQLSDSPLGFPQLILPKLRTLDVGLREVPYSVLWPLPESNNRPLLPDLSQVMPNLTTLVMIDLRLSFKRLSEIVNNFAQRPGGCTLESLTVSTHILCPQLFDLLAEKLPSLQSLTIDYAATSVLTSDSSYDHKVEVGPRFHEKMLARRYPAWGLRYLRLVTLSSCGTPHPRSSTAKIVARSLSPSLIVDVSFSCQCAYE